MSVPLIVRTSTRTNNFSSNNYNLRRLCEANHISRNAKIIQISSPKSKLCLDAEKPPPLIVKGEDRKGDGRGDKKPGKEGVDLSKSLARIKALQERFQRPDGIPVFLKMGIRDQILYRLTMLLAVFGLASIVKMVFMEMK